MKPVPDKFPSSPVTEPVISVLKTSHVGFVVFTYRIRWLCVCQLYLTLSVPVPQSYHGYSILGIIDFPQSTKVSLRVMKIQVNM